MNHIQFSQVDGVITSPLMIQHVKNPSKNVQMAAVMTSVHAIDHIKKPAPEVLKYVFGNELKTEQEQLAAIEKYAKGPYINPIIHIKNPSEKVKIAAVEANARTIRYIKYPSDEVKVHAVLSNWLAIHYVGVVDDEFLLKVVKKNPWYIKNIKYPSEELQLAAIQANVAVLRKIQNPTDKVMELALQKTPKAVQHLMFTMDHEKLIAKLKEHLSNPRVKKKYVRDFLNCGAIKGDKIEFLRQLSSNKAKAIGMEFELGSLFSE